MANASSIKNFSSGMKTGAVALSGNQTASSFANLNRNLLYSQEDARTKYMSIDVTSSGGGQARPQTRAIETANLFSESLAEQAQSRKPAFNTGTFRVPNYATAEGFVRYNPGPGSYSMRSNTIGSQFIDAKGADQVFKGLLSHQGAKNNQNVYYTREKGGLKQHNQPLSLGKTVREGVILNKDAVENMGPGHYQPTLQQDI